jgi:hypothetical protein
VDVFEMSALRLACEQQGTERRLDLEGVAVYDAALGVSQGAFGGRFVARVRKSVPVPLMREATVENPLGVLVETVWQSGSGRI